MTTVEQAWRAAFEPVDRRPIYEVLADDLVFGNESPFPGPFDVRNSPAMKGPLDALAEDGVRRVLVSAGAQLFKTLLGLIFVIYCVRKRPGLTTWNGHTKDAITKACEDKAWPLFEKSASMKTLMPKNRHKRRTRSIVFPHMSLRFQTASKGNAASDTVKNMVNDERHLWQPGMIRRFLGRTHAMPAAKILDLSTGSIKFGEEALPDGTAREHGDEFFNDCRDGTMEVWSVRCPKCGRLQPLRFTHRDARGNDLKDTDGKPVRGIAWNTDSATQPGGRWHFGAVKASVRWKCQADALGISGEPCEHEVRDTRANRRALNATGEYVATNPGADPSIRSFVAPAMCSEVRAWGDMVVDFLKACDAARAGVFDALKVFVQETLGEAWDESGTIKADSNPSGDYALGDEWKDDTGALLEDRRFLTVDRQAGRGAEGVHFWALCRQWSGRAGSRLVAFRRLNSWEEVRAMQQELAIPDKRVLVDAGDEATEVYAWCARYGWTALAGRDRDCFHWPNPAKPGEPIRKLYSSPLRGDSAKGKKAASGPRFARLFLWSTRGVRDILARMIAGSGNYWGRPKNEPDGYAEQLNSEVRVQMKDPKTGRIRHIWKQIKIDNHARDCEAMQVVAALMSPGLIAAAGVDDSEAEAAEAPEGDGKPRKVYRLRR